MSSISETYVCKDGFLERTIGIGNLSIVTRLSNCDISPRIPPNKSWWLKVLQGERIEGASHRSLRTVDMFCGAGGLSLGAQFATRAIGHGMVPIAAVDTDHDALDVYRENFRTPVVRHSNVAALVDFHVYGRGCEAELAYPPEIIDENLSRHAGDVDLFLAGPPCQGHSSLNNHTRGSDPRNQLYVCAAAAAIALRSRAIVIENVPEVLRDENEVVLTAKSILEKAGYFVSQDILNATTFGAGQSRRRHFTIASLQPHAKLEDISVDLARKPMTLRDLIGDLEKVDPQSFMNQVSVLSPENQDRIDFLFDNDMYDLPNSIRPKSHRDGHTYPSVYGRLHWDRPAPTITTGFMTPGRGRYVHPSQRRVITAREAARIQGFPDTFSFAPNGQPPSKKKLAKWIGDAVPSQLGYIAALVAISGLVGASNE